LSEPITASRELVNPLFSIDHERLLIISQLNQDDIPAILIRLVDHFIDRVGQQLDKPMIKTISKTISKT
jgi:hypothetical protein